MSVSEQKLQVFDKGKICDKTALMTKYPVLHPELINLVLQMKTCLFGLDINKSL